MTPNLLLRRTIDEPTNKLPQVLKFCWSAPSIDGDKIGFLTKVAYEGYHSNGQIVTLCNNGDRVGFCLWSTNRWREFRIIQLWVRPDARLILHGKALVAWLEQHEAQRLHSWIMRCWVADDLAANIFWRAIGFDYSGWRWGRAKKSRRHNLYRRLITQHDITRATDASPPEASPTQPVDNAPTMPQALLLLPEAAYRKEPRTLQPNAESSRAPH